MLEIWDNQAKLRKEEREVRLAMLSSGKISPAEAFPDLFEAEGGGDGEEYDYSEVQWESPGSDGTSYDKVMQAIQQYQTVTTRDTSETTEEVKRDSIPLEPEDTEWL